MGDEEGRWVRTEADGLLRDMPDVDVMAVAAELDAKADVYDQGAEMAREIVAELHRRAAAGVRFWTPPKLVD